MPAPDEQQALQKRPFALASLSQREARSHYDLRSNGSRSARAMSTLALLTGPLSSTASQVHDTGCKQKSSSAPSARLLVLVRRSHMSARFRRRALPQPDKGGHQTRAADVARIGATPRHGRRDQTACSVCWKPVASKRLDCRSPHDRRRRRWRVRQVELERKQPPGGNSAGAPTRVLLPFQGGSEMGCAGHSPSRASSTACACLS